jgi:hypothetical protein
MAKKKKNGGAGTSPNNQNNTTRSKTTARKVSRRAPETGDGQSRRRASIARASLSDLEQEIERRTELLRELYLQRDEIAAELTKVEREISRLNGSKSLGAVRARRARNTMNLVQSLQKTLKGKTLSVTDAAATVQREGYKTTSPNFRTIVNQALISNPKVFKKVSRGQYTCK